MQENQLAKIILAWSRRWKEMNQFENIEDLCLRGFIHKLDENYGKGRSGRFLLDFGLSIWRYSDTIY